MRRPLVLIAALLAVIAGVFPAAADESVLTQAAPGPGGFMSSNIEYVATLLSDSPGVGSRVHTMPDGERRYYVSSVQGLRIYNIDDPALPVPIGAFEIGNWENEDVSVSADGKTVLMSEFTGTGYTYIFQVSDPVGPLGTVTITIGDALPLSAAHIVDCMDPACDYFYGSEGQTWDARDKTNVVELPAAQSWGQIIRSQMPDQSYNFGSGHNIEPLGEYDLDADGDLERVAMADTTPMVMMDVTDPLAPTVVTTSMREDHGAARTAYQHNNKLLGFAGHEPRTDAEPVLRDAEGKPTNLRTGELVLGNGETNFTGTCGSGSGPLTSWAAVGWDEGDPIRVIDTFRPVNGTYDGPDASGGNPAVNAIGCSGHWFDVRPDDADASDTIVAAGWYEHGTRVIKVDGQTGSFEQLGFFQPVAGSTSAAHWVVDEESGIYIYTVDYLRGVDILKYDPEAPIDPTEDFDASWFAADPSISEYSAQKRSFCRIATQTAPGLGAVTAPVPATAVLDR